MLIFNALGYKKFTKVTILMYYNYVDESMIFTKLSSLIKATDLTFVKHKLPLIYSFFYLFIT